MFPAEGTRLLARNPEILDLACRRRAEDNPCVLDAVTILKYEADQALHKGPFTIVDKVEMPPSGNKHDYVSMGPYWWPNPDAAGGLPYVRWDGDVNPECNRFDRPRLEAMAKTVGTLSLGWFFFKERPYADRAVQLLRVFFLEERSRMNPHLEFGQFIPGRCQGRGIGIIETTVFATELIDSIGLLLSSPGLTRKCLDGLRSWFSQYLDWLLQSAHGIDEKGQKNNHGTAYDLQVSVFSLFVGRVHIAHDMLASVPLQRIIPQVEPDGRQPHELARTNALSYSSANLNLLFCLAEVAAKLGIDLWHFASDDGRSMRQALDWLVPFWTQAQPWPYQQIAPFPTERAYDLLRKAAWAYGDSAYESALTALPVQPDAARSFRSNLYYPEMAQQSRPASEDKPR